MKKLFRSRYVLTALSAFVMIVAMTHINSCSSPDSEPAVVKAQDAVKAKLIANNWKVSTVTVDGVDQSSAYASLTMQFTSGTYTTTNGRVVWPATDLWTFSSADGSTFKRGDGIDVEIDVTKSTLKLTLTWAKTTLSGGKSDSLSGVNVFSFTK